jgi:YfiH family protein
MTTRNDKNFYLTKLSNGWTVGRFKALDEIEAVVHMVTTRDCPNAGNGNVQAAANEIAGALSVSGVAYCEQVHGKSVLPAKNGGLLGPGDAVVSNRENLALMCKSADCPLILAADPVSGTVGVAHASWRGTVARVASEMIMSMASGFGAKPSDLVVCICPSAGPCCYEVGQDVQSAMEQSLGPAARESFQRRDGKLYLDLWHANTVDIVRSGVHRANIHVAGMCTICTPELFHSYRRDGQAAGRFVGVIAKI